MSNIAKEINVASCTTFRNKSNVIEVFSEKCGPSYSGKRFVFITTRAMRVRSTNFGGVAELCYSWAALYFLEVFQRISFKLRICLYLMFYG